MISNAVGFEEAAEGMRRLKARVPAKTFEALEEIADKIVNDARAYAPIRTGNLRRNIIILSRDESNMKIVVQSGAPYSGFIEYGTSRMFARPFMQPAADNAEATLPNVARRKMEEAR